MKRESNVIGRWPDVGGSMGLHLLGDWFGCAGNQALLEDAGLLQHLCLTAARRAGLPVDGQLFHRCGRGGVTGMVLLADSHLAIHTRPDERSVALDVFLNVRTPNHRAKAHAVYELLRGVLLPDKENVLQVGGGPADGALPLH
jgi:S-adenosylmethionine/arginine decarboxylase-like enzyme